MQSDAIYAVMKLNPNTGTTMSNVNAVLVQLMAVMTIYGAVSKNLVASPISQ